MVTEPKNLTGASFSGATIWTIRESITMKNTLPYSTFPITFMSD